MTYKEVWEEQKEWLEKSIDYLKQRKEETKGKEKERITAKLEGLKVSYHHMLETEKIYSIES